MTIRNINETRWEEYEDQEGNSFKQLDLSGEHIGVRIEELQPGGTSSTHHYHTLEEEHVLVLEGSATLVLGSERQALNAGDHVWFKAGKEEAHHIKNTSQETFKYLVFGERNQQDVVFYPGQKTMMVRG